MIRPLFVAITVVFMSLSTSVLSAETCAPDQRRLNDGEPCIPETLFSYLYCLSKSNGGRVEITKKDDASAAKRLEISVGGKGSGVIVKGEGNVGFDRANANRVIREVSERIDPSLASKCEALSRHPSKSARTPTRTTESDLPPGKASAAVALKVKRTTGGPLGVKEMQLQPEMESVDFLVNEPELTERSLAYIADLSKKFSVVRDPRITLVPEYRTQLLYEQDRLSESEVSIRVRRQIAVRNALVAYGFPSDSIFMEQGQANIADKGVRMDNKGRRIESGMMVQAWP